MAENTKSAEVLQAQRNPDQPGDTRCTRNDGKVWRCKKPRVEGNRFCESHVKTVNGGGSGGTSKAGGASKRRHSTSDIVAPPQPAEKKPRRVVNDSDDDDSDDASLQRMQRRQRNPPPSSRRKTIETDKVMHLNGGGGKEKGTQLEKTPPPPPPPPLKVYKKETSVNGKFTNGQRIVKKEYAESSSEVDSDDSLEKQVTRGRRPKEV